MTTNEGGDYRLWKSLERLHYEKACEEASLQLRGEHGPMWELAGDVAMLVIDRIRRSP